MFFTRYNWNGIFYDTIGVEFWEMSSEFTWEEVREENSDYIISSGIVSGLQQWRRPISTVAVTFFTVSESLHSNCEVGYSKITVTNYTVGFKMYVCVISPKLCFCNSSARLKESNYLLINLRLFSSLCQLRMSLCDGKKYHLGLNI